MRELGAEVRLHGRDFDEARQECERVATAEGFRYIHSANEPALIAGVGTIGLEIFRRPARCRRDHRARRRWQLCFGELPRRQ